MNLGANIKNLRKMYNMSQKELAQKLDISDKTISSWEINRTEPSMLYIQKLGEIFNCTNSEIIYGKEMALSKEEAVLDARISNDLELKEMIKKYYSLPREKQELIINLVKNM